MKKNILLMIVIAMFSSFGFIQSANAQKVNLNKNTWTLLMEKNGVQVFYKYEDCNDVKNGIFQENVYMKFVNTTKMNVQLDWDLKTWFNDVCSNPSGNNPESHFSTNLSSGETKSGSCEKRHELKEFVLFSKFLNMENRSVLTKFVLENFIVKPL